MRKLIIVCEERLRRYGDFLAQLISGKDDTEGKIMGIPDGTAVAQVWTEKEYTTNAAQISSEQYILFIGNSRLIKEKRYHMQRLFSEYGLNYGWLGKQAVLFVDRMLTVNEYDSFYELVTNEFAAGNQPEAIRLIPVKQESDKVITEIVTETADEGTGVVPEMKDQEDSGKKSLKKLLGSLDAAKKVIKKTTDISKDTFGKVSENLGIVVKARELEEQQYSCLVLMFYLNDLAAFLGINEG